MENATVKDLAGAMVGTSLAEQLPRRPGYGTSGQQVVLWTNYLPVTLAQKDLVLYRYSVAIQPKAKDEKSKGEAEGELKPDDLPKPKRKRLVQLLLQQTPFAKLATASDWAQTIVCTEKVPLNGPTKDGPQRFKIEWYSADGEPLPHPTADEPAERTKARKRNTYTLIVESIGEVSVGELQKDLSSASTLYSLKSETIQALNLLMTHGPSTDASIIVAGQNKFYPLPGHPQHVSIALGGGLEALRGYYSSVRTSVSRIILNVNVATTAFYKSGPMMQVLHELGTNDPRRLNAFVRKLRFETSYIPEKDKNGKQKMLGGRPVFKRKVHVISELSARKAAEITFETTDAKGAKKNVTVAAHFRTTYGVQLKSDFFTVNYGTMKDPKWIPAELCTILPGQPAKRLLQGSQTQQMIRFAARRPAENAKSIMNDGLLVTKVKSVSPQGQNLQLEKFGLEVDPKLLTVIGRVLRAPALLYRAQQSCTPLNGAWNLDIRQLGNEPFRMAKTLGAWNVVIINIGRPTTFETDLKQQLEIFRATLNKYGLKAGPVAAPITIDLDAGHVQNKNIGAIQQTIEATVRGKLKSKPNFLFVLLANDNAVVYDSIKFVFDVKFGIPNVCNVASKFAKERGKEQYFANVAMKFNQKLGGINHTVSAEQFKPLDAQTILFGIDVTHPSPGSDESSPSIAGVVASVDGNFSQYPASIRTQTGRVEMVEDLKDMILERLRLWSKRNGRLPTKVIVYRDGVSEGQYRLVLEQELPAFTKAFNELYGKAQNHPKVSIVIVGKRHHTRFFPTRAEDADGRTGNPKPGTVVDRGVTGEKIFDFFLLAHQGLQGTSKPAHYVVIKDDNKLGADQLQQLTHNLCYTFARATRSVSICPPAYYADLLCERGRSYLQGVLKGEGAEKFLPNSWHGGVHENLAETMFYL